jgi:hypothetical protein
MTCKRLLRLVPAEIAATASCFPITELPSLLDLPAHNLRPQLHASSKVRSLLVLVLVVRSLSHTVSYGKLLLHRPQLQVASEPDTHLKSTPCLPIVLTRSSYLLVQSWCVFMVPSNLNLPGPQPQPQSQDDSAPSTSVMLCRWLLGRCRRYTGMLHDTVVLTATAV